MVDTGSARTLPSVCANSRLSFIFGFVQLRGRNGITTYREALRLTTGSMWHCANERRMVGGFMIPRVFIIIASSMHMYDLTSTFTLEPRSACNSMSANAHKSIINASLPMPASTRTSHNLLLDMLWHLCFALLPLLFLDSRFVLLALAFVFEALAARLVGSFFEAVVVVVV